MRSSRRLLTGDRQNLLDHIKHMSKIERLGHEGGVGDPAQQRCAHSTHQYNRNSLEGRIGAHRVGQLATVQARHLTLLRTRS